MIRGDLTPKCATAVRAALEALGTGKKAGPQDDRSEGRRFHDAPQLPCAPLPAPAGPRVAVGRSQPFLPPLP